MQDSDQGLFHMARVGLGSLGVVTEVTLQCVPAHELVEHTYVATSNEVRKQHAQLLRNNKHVRYMWIPYTHDVVVVTNNPLQQVSLVRKLLLYMHVVTLPSVAGQSLALAAVMHTVVENTWRASVAGQGFAVAAAAHGLHTIV